MRYQAILFDLDGVLVDTARLHFEAWREIAGSLGIQFDIHDNEALKGVGRRDSLELILEMGFRTQGDAIILTEEEFIYWMALKNQRYLEQVKTLTPEDVLPGVLEFINHLQVSEIKVAVVSSSKNAVQVLEQIGLAEHFTVVIDGNMTTRSKPDPQGALLAARRLGIAPEYSVLIEDAISGIEAAKRAGMGSVGVGDAKILISADLVIKDFVSDWKKLMQYLEIEEVKP